jgi:hypothetical protein
MNSYEQLSYCLDATKRNDTALGRKLGSSITLEQADEIYDEYRKEFGWIDYCIAFENDERYNPKRK